MKAKKYFRVLWLYMRLADGKSINTSYVANLFMVDIRTIQRDLSDIKDFLQRTELNQVRLDVLSMTITNVVILLIYRFRNSNEILYRNGGFLCRKRINLQLFMM